MTTRATAHAEPILSARGIVNRFGKQVVHDKLSLDIVPGEIIGVASVPAPRPAVPYVRASAA
jgi:ABC-type transporter Mla maintaining outer membrane lipid asymmetry ATPase subunit MlaF